MSEESSIKNTLEQKRLQSEKAYQQLLQEFEEEKRAIEVAKRHLKSNEGNQSAKEGLWQNFLNDLEKANKMLLEKAWTKAVNILEDLVQINITNFTDEGTNCLTELLNFMNKCLKLVNVNHDEKALEHFKRLLVIVNDELLSRTIKHVEVSNDDENSRFDFQVLQDVIINQEEDLQQQHAINADILIDEAAMIKHELFAIAANHSDSAEN